MLWDLNPLPSVYRTEALPNELNVFVSSYYARCSVRMGGFEPPLFCSQSKRITWLSYILRSGERDVGVIPLSLVADLRFERSPFPYMGMSLLVEFKAQTTTLLVRTCVINGQYTRTLYHWASRLRLIQPFRIDNYLEATLTITVRNVCGLLSRHRP